MEQTPPRATDPGPGERSSAAEADVFARLEATLEQASKTAERVISEAAAEAAAAATRLGGRAMPRPQARPATGDSGAAQPVDLELLTELMTSARDLVPVELRRRLAEAVQEVLLAIRALIDWYLERLEPSRGEPDAVEDIPII